MRYTIYKLSDGYAMWDNFEQKYAARGLSFEAAIEFEVYEDA